MQKLKRGCYIAPCDGQTILVVKTIQPVFMLRFITFLALVASIQLTTNVFTQTMQFGSCNACKLLKQELKLALPENLAIEETKGITSLIYLVANRWTNLVYQVGTRGTNLLYQVRNRGTNLFYQVGNRKTSLIYLIVNRRSNLMDNIDFGSELNLLTNCTFLRIESNKTENCEGNYVVFREIFSEINRDLICDLTAAIGKVNSINSLLIGGSKTNTSVIESNKESKFRSNWCIAKSCIVGLIRNNYWYLFRPFSEICNLNLIAGYTIYKSDHFHYYKFLSAPNYRFRGLHYKVSKQLLS